MLFLKKYVYKIDAIARSFLLLIYDTSESQIHAWSEIMLD